MRASPSAIRCGSCSSLMRPTLPDRHQLSESEDDGSASGWATPPVETSPISRSFPRREATEVPDLKTEQRRKRISEKKISFSVFFVCSVAPFLRSVASIHLRRLEAQQMTQRGARRSGWSDPCGPGDHLVLRTPLPTLAARILPDSDYCLRVGSGVPSEHTRPLVWASPRTAGVVAP